MELPPPPVEAIRAALERVLASAPFRGANRSGTLLKFVVETALDGRGHQLKEYTLGADALGRGTGFDPRVDPIVRVEASRLRGRLEQYYAKEGAADAVLISLPKGSYVPQFALRAAPAEPPPGRDAQPGPGSAAPAAREPDARRARWRDALWLAGGGAIATAFAVWFSYSAAVQSPQPERALQLDIALGAPGQIAAGVGSSLAISPDGRTLAFVSLARDGSTRLYARRLDDLEAKELEGSSGAEAPFFSPDGRWIGFWTGGQLKKTLAAGGGSPITITESPDLLGASWAEDGTIIATLDKAGNLWRVPEDGGTPTLVMTFDRDAQLARWPQVLPGGEAALVTTTRPSGTAIELVRLDGSERRALVQTGSYGRYLASGHLAYVDRGTLFAVPFDLASGKIHGTPAPVLRDVAYDPQFGFAQLDVARDGTLVYLRSSAPGASTVRWLDGAGAPRPLLAEPARYQWPRLSADGRRLAYVLLEGADPDVWTLDLASGTKTRVTGAGVQGTPLLTLDGEFVLYYDATTPAMLWRRADGTGTPQTLVAGIANPWSFTADGRRLAYQVWSDETSFDLWTVPLETTAEGLRAGTPERFLASHAFENYPAISPDGRWLAHCSNEAGAWEVYVRAFPDNGSRVRASTNGGCIASWSRAGERLFYEAADRRVMSVRYRVDGGKFVPEVPEALSDAQLADTGVLANFDVAPDGRSVVALLAAGEPPPRDHVTLVLGFLQSLRAQAR